MRILFATLLGAVCALCGSAKAAPSSPRMLFQNRTVHDPTAPSGTRAAYAILRLPDGSFAFYDRYRPQAGPLTLPDRDGQRHSLTPHLPPHLVANRAIIDSGVFSNTQVILGTDGELKSVYVKNEALDRQTAAKVGLPRYLNVWIRCASPTGIVEPEMIWRGYNGSQMEYQQLTDGRLVVPYGSFIPHARAVPPTGRHETVIQLSDDGGRTWNESPSKLTSPCYPGFNGNNEGACEPAFEQLKDGRVWMLMRTQAGFLYESVSRDNGSTWAAATASRFNASTGPPNILRHKNGWLVVAWNNCEMPPRQDGQGVYGGRDALHIAASDDEGKTWRGFREIYLDHRRNGNPAKSGDRGTAYPVGAYTDDGTIVMLAGQGTGGRNPILIDPDWIVETSAATDFSDGLDQWSVYKHHGPAKRWWQARADGARLISNPTELKTQCLQVRKADELPADGATWNFPNGWEGSLTARIMIRKGGQGGTLCLNDRMFDPCNDFGEEFAVFRVGIGSDGKMGDKRLTAGQWHDVRLSWNLGTQTCQLSVDGQPAGSVPLRNESVNGVSYVRFRSAATKPDPEGFLIDRVSVSIEDPSAPIRSSQELVAHEQRYVQKVVPHWTAE
jgi:hypothetical protein